MEVQERGYFWRGRVETRSHALRLISTAGFTFVVLGLLSGLAATRAGSQRELFGILVMALLMGAPGAILLARKSRAPAVAMLVVSTLCAGTFLAVPFIRLFRGASLAESFPPLGGLVLWALLGLLSWRAFVAAAALPRLPEEGAEGGEEDDEAWEPDPRG